MIGIYKITNKLNEKAYIGQSVDIERRFYSHKNNLKKSSKSWYPTAREESQSIDDFLFEVIEECAEEDLDQHEKYWIEYYDSYESGYNLTSNGQAIIESKRKEIIPFQKTIIYPKGNNELKEIKRLLVFTKNCSIETLCLLDYLDKEEPFLFFFKRLC